MSKAGKVNRYGILYCHQPHNDVISGLESYDKKKRYKLSKKLSSLQ